MTRLWRLLLAFGLLMIFLVATPGVAGAHAQLESSEPGQSAVLLVPPTRVLLHFGEPVEINFGSLRVIGPGGARVDGGAAHHPDADTHAVTTSLSGNLPNGTYIVAWRVVSADSHPVHGAYVFSVGSAKGAARADAIAASIANQGGDAAVGFAYWLVRTAAFIGLLVLVGLALVVSTLWREGGRTRRVARLLWWSWWAVLVCTLLGVIVQGVVASAWVGEQANLDDAHFGANIGHLLQEPVFRPTGGEAIPMAVVNVCIDDLQGNLRKDLRGGT